MNSIDANAVVLAVCSFGFTGVLTYAVWCKARVVFIREELFAVRDRLWDAARELDGFDDPAYLEARDHLNAGIKVVPSFSIRMLNYFIKKRRVGSSPRMASSNEELQAAIDRAYADSGRWFTRYILLWRASGWLFMLRFTLQRRLHAIQAASTEWLQSKGPSDLAECEAFARAA